LSSWATRLASGRWQRWLIAMVLLVAVGGAASYAAFVCSRTVEVSTAAGSAAARPAFERLTVQLARRGTEVLLVLRDGELLYEWYAPKPRLLPAAEGRRSLASMVKGVLWAAWGWPGWRRTG
jgi:hypothetical protein